MAWLIGDGFDFYNAASDVLLPGTVWQASGSSNPRLTATTRFGVGLAGIFSFNGDTWQSVSFANSTTVFINFAVMNTITLVAGNAIGQSFRLLDAGVVQCGLVMIEDGSFALVNNAGTIITGTRTAASTVLPNQWNHIQAKIVIDPTNGSFEMRLNGSTTPIISVAGLNTRNTGNSFCNSFNMTAPNVALVQAQVDDFYLHNDQGAQPNTYQGDIRAVQMMPSSDASTAWTPNSGTLHYNRVNELREDGDTSYVLTASNGAVDQYGLTALSPTPLSIVAVQSKMFARMDDAGPHTVRSRLISGGTTSDSPDLTCTTNYQWQQQMYVTDPHTGGAWSPTNLALATIGPVDTL